MRSTFLLEICIFYLVALLNRSVSYSYFLRWEMLLVPSSFLLLFLRIIPFSISMPRNSNRNEGYFGINRKFFFPRFHPTSFFIYTPMYLMVFSREPLPLVFFSLLVFSLDSLPLFTIPFDPSLFFTLLRVHLGRKNDEVNREEGGKRKKTIS